MEQELEIKPCPFCGNELPFSYISPFTVVLRCRCGACVDNHAATVLYQRDKIPDELVAYSYEPTLLVIVRDGKEVKYPEHGYIGVNAIAALRYEGALHVWNNRHFY